MAVKPASQIVREIIVTYLTTRWTRSYLATLTDPPVIPDPGFGEDQICPMIFYGDTFDPSNPEALEDLTDYTVRELRGYDQDLATLTSGPWSGETVPINFIDQQWILSTSSGPVIVTPDIPIVDGITVTLVAAGYPDSTATIAAGYLRGVGFIALELREGESEFLGQVANPIRLRVTLQPLIAIPPSEAPLLAERYLGGILRLCRGVAWKCEPGLTDDLRRDMSDSRVNVIRQIEAPQEFPVRLGESGWSWYSGRIEFEVQHQPHRMGIQSPTP